MSGWEENLKSLETYDERVQLPELPSIAGDAFQGCYNQSVGGGKSAQGESPRKKLAWNGRSLGMHHCLTASD